jgi:hypothetical protein
MEAAYPQASEMSETFRSYRGDLMRARFQKNGWWARQDSNLGPNRYERSALTN